MHKHVLFATSVLAAFIVGAFVASPELRAYAAATVGSAEIIDNSIQSIDIKNGEVKGVDVQAGVSLTGSAKIDSPTFAVDSTNNRVGIGTTAPVSTLDVVSVGTPTPGIFTSTTGTSFIHTNAQGDNPNSGIGFDTKNSMKWSASALQLNSGKIDFRIKNEQGLEALRIDGDNNRINLGGDMDCFGCVEGSDIQGLKKLIFNECTVTFTPSSAPTGQAQAGICNVPGAAVGDIVIVTRQTPSNDVIIPFTILSAKVQSAGQVRILAENITLGCGGGGTTPCTGSPNSLETPTIGIIVFKTT